MWMFMLLVLFLSAISYRYLSTSYDYWKKRGIPHPPVNILFGNFLDSITLKRSLGQLYMDIYNAFPGLPYVGFYKMRQPALLVRDADLIQEVLIRDFSSFHDNDIVVDEKVDPIMAKNPFTLRGNHWKVVRNQIITCFTSKRMKAMFPLMEEVGIKLVKYLEEEPDATGKNGLEVKEVAAKFTTDNVASCAYGIDAQSFTNPHAEFRTIGEKFLTPSFIQGMQHLCVMIFPALAKVLNVKFFPDEVSNYIRTTVFNTLKYRRENNIVRNDFLDLMTELKTKSDYEFTDEDIVAHAGGFFGDGFETSSIALAFALYEIAANPDVQERLRDEVDGIIEQHDGKITYDGVQEMTYMDNVLFESLRKHPPALMLARVCTKEYTFPPLHGEGSGPRLVIEKDTPVIIPLYAIQRDERYFPDPEKFDPDRFSDENKNNLTKCAYLSFGEGPRICLGQRFGVLQVKMAIVYIMQNFEIKVNKRTVEPPVVNPQYFLMRAKDGLWLNFYKRTKI